MPWVIGIDEAGYGPNLGPLVQAAVPLRTSDGDIGGWKSLSRAVRRAHEKDDGRLLIDDSKKAYARGGIGTLERGIQATIRLLDLTVGGLVRSIGLPECHDDLVGEAWYDPSEPLPVAAVLEDISAARDSLADGLPEGVGFGPPVAAVIPAPRFNRVSEAAGSKAAVLWQGWIDLMRAMLAALPRGDERVTVCCDKHGGRNYYVPMIQEAFPDGWVVTEVEGALESRYRVELLDRPVTVVFRPRADGDSAATAAASMLCKYVREVCMRQFNRYWIGHVPELVPTAGYPEDAKRFLEAIRPTMDRLKLTFEQVWRKR